jgi:beta-lactamase class A
MFKLFVLGALAHQIASGRVSWSQELTTEPSLTSIGSPQGSLQYSPPGTRVTVRQTAIKMISISDNTAADMLIHLVGRPAVEAQVERWATQPGRDEPFLTTRELFLLHYADFPSLADAYLSRTPSQRRAFLAASVDPLSLDHVHASSAPRDVGSLEWFASPDDLCRAFSGLQALHRRPALAPLGTVLSTNTGSLGLDPARWPTVWFKGGSEPGVLTLGYRAVADNGTSYVVVAMVEDPVSALPPSATIQLIDIVKGAFGLLH